MRYLTRPKVSIIIPPWHDGVRQGDRLGSGETYEWFEDNQENRRGCRACDYMTPDGFNIFFAVGEDQGRSTASRWVRRCWATFFIIRIVGRGGTTRGEIQKWVIWAMLYAGEAGIAPRSQPRLAIMTTAIVEVSVRNLASKWQKRARKQTACTTEALQKKNWLGMKAVLKSTTHNMVLSPILAAPLSRDVLEMSVQRSTAALAIYYSWICSAKDSEVAYDNPYIGLFEKSRFLKARKVIKAETQFSAELCEAFGSTNWMNGLAETYIETSVMKSILLCTTGGLATSRTCTTTYSPIVMRGEKWADGGKRKANQPAKRVLHVATQHYCSAFGIDTTSSMNRCRLFNIYAKDTRS